MSEKFTPAFPSTVWGVDTRGRVLPQAGFCGMELRDYFAAKAMQAMITTAGAPLGGLDGYEEHNAAAAYKIADAMLQERDK